MSSDEMTEDQVRIYGERLRAEIMRKAAERRAKNARPVYPTRSIEYMDVRQSEAHRSTHYKKVQSRR
jgi:hypothetical protein